MSNFLNNANKNWSVVAGQIQNQAANGIVYIKPSAFQIPVGVSNERPTGEAGMIRYLTSENVIEYYNANTGSWIPINQQPPEIISIDPQYYPLGSTDPLTINGSNFFAGTTVTFIGNDGTIYGPNGSSFITSSQLSCSVPIGVNSLNDPFDVKVTNPSGLSSQLDNSLFINENPIFVTSQTPSVYATIDVSTVLTGQLDISATDPENHYPISFSEISGNNITPLILETSGVISGTVPFPTPITATSQSIVFTVQAIDDFSASSIGSFTYVINRPENDINVSSFGTLGVDYTRTYLDTIEGSGNTVGSPVIGGSTVYQFKSTGLTGNIAPSSNPFNLNYCVVAGGGAGGCSQGGGGGAGGVKLGNLYLSTSNNVSVGIGGTGNVNTNTAGGNGFNSILGSITATGGGGGGGGNRNGSNSSSPGQGGGSGGGGAGMFNSVQGGGTGILGEGNTGGSGFGAATGPESRAEVILGGGGGGANIKGGKSTSVGNGQITGSATGDGGAGILTTITGSNVYYGGGGGGGAALNGDVTTFGVGGIGGGGNGRVGGYDDTYGGNGLSGTTNTGGGGGGGGGGGSSGILYYGRGGDGGSGIVIVRFPSYTFSTPINYLTVSSVNNVYYNISYLNTSLSQVDYPDPSGYTVYIFNSANNTTSGTVTATPNNTIDISYVVVGGGGSGGTGQGGGGGAGGVVIGYNGSVSSALNLTIGAGGIPADTLYSQPGAKGTNGSNSTITGAFTSTAGGGGAGGGTNSGGVSLSNGNSGNSTNGSGGGGGANSDGTTYGLGGSGDGTGGNGGQGNNGGTGYGGGGGGASAIGSNSSGGAGAGGAGTYSSILGYNVGGGGGGGSGGAGIDGASGGLGGGGQGRGTALVAGGALYTDPKVGENGVNGTGGGGGGGAFGSASFMGGNGGSGVIGILFRTSS